MESGAGPAWEDGSSPAISGCPVAGWGSPKAREKQW